MNKTNMPPEMLLKSMQMLQDTYKENHRVTEEETTKRIGIEAEKEVHLRIISSQKAILEQYLEGIFSERKEMIHHMFEVLDKGIETNNMELVQQGLGSIIAVAKESPLAGVQKLLNDYDNPDIEEITI